MLPPANKTYALPASGPLYVGQSVPGDPPPTGGGVSTGVSGVGSVAPQLLTASGTSGNIMAIRPTPGNLKSVHASDLATINPCPDNACWYSGSTKQNGPWANWCGSVFASDYSQYGAMVFWGGGHGGYSGSELYIFDLTTQLWSRLNDPVNYPYLADTSADWCDVVFTDDNQIPPPQHTNSLPVYISAAQGGGSKGSWCVPFMVYGGGPTEGAGTSGFQPHVCDLATGQWRRLTDNTIMNLPYVYGANGSCFTDTNRDVIWGAPGSESWAAAKIDLKVTPRHLVQVNGAITGGVLYAISIFVPEVDMVAQVSIYGDGQKRISLTMYDMATGSPVNFQPTFASPQVGAIGNPGIAIDYCPDTNKFYCYEAFGTNVLYVATPPAGPIANWKTGTWTWSTETMGGESPVNIIEVVPTAQGGQPFTKWKYHRGLKCFMWSGGTAVRNSPDGTARAGAFQLYRPLGT